jgi:hypothetical protein
VSSERHESSFLRTLRRALVEDARREIAFVIAVRDLQAKGHSSAEILRLVGLPPGSVRLTGSTDRLRDAYSQLERAPRPPRPEPRPPQPARPVTRPPARVRTAPGPATRWTTETIVAAARAWAREYGSLPRPIDWDRSAAKRDGRADRLERLASRRWPAPSTVLARFGSWEAMLAAVSETGAPAP